MNREMIDSGIEWIGKIPSNWKTSRIGSEFKVRNQKVSDKDYMPLSVTKLTEGIVPQMDQVAKSDAHDDRKLVLKGDFVINSRSDRKMSCGVSNYDGSVSLINIVLEPVGEILPNYTHYLLKNYAFAEEFYKWGHGIVADLWTTNSSDLKRITVPFPNIEEQQKILKTLDNKIFQIDKLIANQEKQIEALKTYKQALITRVVTKGLNPEAQMKDSGIEWIGKIPSNWKMIPNKYLFIEHNNKVGDNWKYYQLLSLTTKGVREKDINSSGGKVPDSYDNYQIVKPGDMIFCLFDLDVSAVFSGLSNLNGMITSAYNVCSINKKLVDESYANYWFQYVFSNRYYKIYSKNIRYTVTSENFGLIATVCPPLQEQIKIGNYLNKRISQIDDLISLKYIKIEKLKYYKESIIFEYVTGKNVVD